MTFPSWPGNKGRCVPRDSHTTDPSPDLHGSPQHETERDVGALTLPLQTDVAAGSPPPLGDVPSMVLGVTAQAKALLAGGM